MIVRKVNEQDIEAVSAVCMASFMRSVAATLTEQGIATFSNIAARDSFLARMNDDNVMLVAEVDGNVEGVIELKEGRHIAMLFVNPERQKQGIGRALLSAALNEARADSVTVSASLTSVSAYQKYGFECRGETGESAGLVYQPMVLEHGLQPNDDRSSL